MMIISIRERLAKEKETLVAIGSDQTSCHNPYHGGYYPVQVTNTDKHKYLHING